MARRRKNPGPNEGIIMGNLAEMVLRLPGGEEVKIRPKGRLLGYLLKGKRLIIMNRRRLGGVGTLGADVLKIHKRFHNASPTSVDRFEWPDQVGRKRRCGRIVSLMYTIPPWLKSPEKDRYKWDHEFGDHGERGHGEKRGRGNYPEKYMPYLTMDQRGNLFIDRAPGNKYYVTDWLYW